MTRKPSTTHKQQMRAYRRGLKAGQQGAPYVSPYTAPKLMDEWIHGYRMGTLAKTKTSADEVAQV